jgi:hypothetical protein
MEFTYYDFYSGDILSTFETYKGNKLIPKRDIVVRCSIYDSNDDRKIKNYVPIKFYKYMVASVDANDLNNVIDIIYKSDDIYD